MSADVPVACIPGAIDEKERNGHFELVRRLFSGRVRERTAPDELPDGYGYRFDSDDFPDLMGFVLNERLCCPFLAFDISVAPNGGPIWLKVNGPSGTRAFLDAELQATG